MYDPASPFLSGGNLPNVLAKFAAATYILSPDTLQEMIADAGEYAAAGEAAGLSVMASRAQPKFDMSSNPSGGITDQLTVPVTVTATTTPQSFAAAAAAQPPSSGSGTAHATAVSGPTNTFSPVLADAAVRQPISIISRIPVGPVQLPVGQEGNTPTVVPASPSIVQVELDAFIPVEALLGTGISSLPIGTAFFAQPLGDGAQFQRNTVGTVLNLCDAHRATYALTPIDLPIQFDRIEPDRRRPIRL